MSKNRNLIIIALVAIVNALGYGIIIPVLYSYSKRFGLTDFQNGLLFSVFAICQFLSTPIIGRLSDKYGRRPLLLVSLFGTFLSFVLMGFAQNIVWLFIARIVDGVTAGNISVASAVISDTTDKKDRAKGFGIIGAAFGFGFVFGPAISGITYSIHEYYPFFIAAGISLLSFVATWIFLPETNKHEFENKKTPLFDFKHLFGALLDDKVGRTLLVSALYSLAFSIFIYGYQPFAVKILNLSTQTIAFNFTLIGLAGALGQVLLVPYFVKKFGERKMMYYSLFGVFLIFSLLPISKVAVFYISLTIINSLFNSFIGPVIQSILSKEVDEKSQGSIMGINSSYFSLGSIFGPLIGGLVATYNIHLPFLAAAAITITAFILSTKISKNSTPEAVF